MKTVSIRELKNNPSAALREAQQDDLVVVMNRDTPQAVLVDLARMGLPDMPGVRFALAVALFRQGGVSLGYAARVAGRPVAEMIDQLARIGIPIVNPGRKDVEHDIAAIDAWKAGKAI